MQRDRGTVTGFVAVIAASLVFVAGMAFDGGAILTAQARARDLAENAARAGAQEIDIAELRATGDAVLDPVAAEAAARRYLASADPAAEASLIVSDARIEVTVTVNQPMHILPASDRRVVASSAATAVSGT